MYRARAWFFLIAYSPTRGANLTAGIIASWRGNTVIRSALSAAFYKAADGRQVSISSWIDDKTGEWTLKIQARTRNKENFQMVNNATSSPVVPWWSTNNLTASNPQAANSPVEESENTVPAKLDEAAVTEKPGISLNPLPPYTRINGHTIPRTNLPLYSPAFTPADCTAHLSHEEWWASLDHEIRLLMDSKNNVPGTGEHLAHLDSEGRFHAVNAARMDIERDKYFTAVDRALAELAESLGLRFAGVRRMSLPSDPNQLIHKAFFECPDGGEGKIVVILPCGTKVFTNTPKEFTQEDFSDFSMKVLNELMEQISNNEMSMSRMRRFFEEKFEQFFPAAQAA